MASNLGAKSHVFRPIEDGQSHPSAECARPYSVSSKTRQKVPQEKSLYSTPFDTTATLTDVRRCASYESGQAKTELSCTSSQLMSDELFDLLLFQPWKVTPSRTGTREFSSTVHHHRNPPLSLYTLSVLHSISKADWLSLQHVEPLQSLKTQVVGHVAIDQSFPLAQFALSLHRSLRRKTTERFVPEGSATDTVMGLQTLI